MSLSRDSIILKALPEWMRQHAARNLNPKEMRYIVSKATGLPEDEIKMTAPQLLGVVAAEELWQFAGSLSTELARRDDELLRRGQR